MLGELEDLAAVDPDALEDTVAVEQPVVVDRHHGGGPVAPLTVQPDRRGTGVLGGGGAGGGQLGRHAPNVYPGSPRSQRAQRPSAARSRAIQTAKRRSRSASSRRVPSSIRRSSASNRSCARATRSSGGGSTRACTCPSTCRRWSCARAVPTWLGDAPMT